MDTHERDELLIRIDERLAHLVESDKDQEVRIRGLEKFRNWLLGAFGLGGASAGGYTLF